MLIISNLRVKMAERGFSIKDVHEKTELSRTTISNFYNDISDGIKYSTLEKCCELFNCMPNDLLKVVKVNINELDLIDETKDGSNIYFDLSLKVNIDNSILNQTIRIKLELDEDVITTGFIVLEDKYDFDTRSLNYSENAQNKIIDHCKAKVVELFINKYDIQKKYCDVLVLDHLEW